MGVPLEDWVATINRHPTKYKFVGLDGFHRFLGDAISASEEYRKSLLDNESSYRLELLQEEANAFHDRTVREATELVDEDEAPNLYGFLCFVGQWIVGRWNRDAQNEDLDTAINAYGGGWAHDEATEMLEYIGTDPPEITDELLAAHPIEEVWSHAFECGVSPDHIAFFCPSCGREPIDIEDIPDGYMHCGLCGCETSHTNTQALLRFIEKDMELSVFPFRRSDP